MGRRVAKTGGQLKPKAEPIPVATHDSDNDSDDSENMMKFSNAKKADSDEEEDQEVFDLAMDESGSDNNDSGDDDDDDDDDDSDGSENSDFEDEENDLQNLVDNLPQGLRQKVLMKNGQEDSDSDKDEDHDDEEEEGWGSKRKSYYDGDTPDLEIGQDVGDADEEAAAALELHRGKLSRMQEEDFDEGLGADSDSESEEEENMGSKLKGKAAAAAKTGASRSAKKALKASAGMEAQGLGELELVALGQSHNAANVQIEHISRDLSKLSKDQRLELIAAQSPEFMGIVSELQERVAELKTVVMPVKELVLRVAATSRVNDDIVEYLEVKQQLLLSYCVNVVFYLFMKAEGRSVRAHPVMKQLLKLRYVMEKMRSLDSKLKYQIDRLVKIADMKPDEAATHAASGLLRPNPGALLARDGDDSEDASEDGEDEDEEDHGRGAKRGGASDGLYRPPRMTAMPYKESESQAAKRDSRLDKQRKKLKSSELMEALQHEFGTAPEVSASGGISTQSGDLKRLAEEADERRKFEEDKFVRLTMTRKDKKSIKRRTEAATRLDNFDDIGDVGDLDEIAKLAAASRGASSSRRGATADEDDDHFDRKGGKSSHSASALQNAVDALSGDHRGSKKSSSKHTHSDDDEDDPYSAMLAGSSSNDGKKRRRAPEMGNDEGDDDLLEDFGRKKKAFLAKKQEHYTAEPRYGGLEESVRDGAKRAATYEIMKNRGLTPHRKKANRNPRVKKREAYAKAVVSRKGQVRDVITGAAGAYGGELTGIKANIARSRKIGGGN